MKGQTGFIVAVAFALIIAIFAVINVDSVEVNYLFGTGQAPLILIILGSVLMGGLIGGVFGAIRNYKLKRTNRTLQRRIQELESTSNSTHDQQTTQPDQELHEQHETKDSEDTEK